MTSSAPPPLPPAAPPSRPLRRPAVARPLRGRPVRPSPDTLFFTVATGRYEIFALPYAASVLHHNRNAALEILVDSEADFLERYGGGMVKLLRTYGNGRFLARAVPDHLRHIKGNKLRFLAEPQVRLPYVYIGDVDILILDKNVTRWHLTAMSKSKLPYSNQMRRGHKERMTGLHFTRHDAYYPVPQELITRFREFGDEQIPYHVHVTHKALSAPPPLGRPQHGIHTSPHRPSPLGENGLGWGVTELRWKQYLDLKASPSWQSLLPHLHSEYHEVLREIEGAAAKLGFRDPSMLPSAAVA